MDDHPTPMTTASQPNVPNAEKASGSMRLLALVLTLSLAFGGVVMVLLALNPDETPRCEELIAKNIS
jgi:hypothetical protein